MISCAPYESATNSYGDIKAKRSSEGFKFFAEVRPYSNHKNLKHGFVASSKTSQEDANKIALDGCLEDYSKEDCFLYIVGNENVWEENIAHIKAKEEEEKKNKELAEQRKKEEVLLTSINLKRGTCAKMGFESETEGMANCVLQLMLQENQGQTTTTIDNSGMVSAMNTQNAIMQKQLRLQRLEHTQKQMKTFQYMMDHGKMPPFGYGY